MSRLKYLVEPQHFVLQCRKYLKSLGFNSEYDYERYIIEESNELINNHDDGKHLNNRALLVDDLVDTAWCILAKLTDVPYIRTGNHVFNNVDSQMRAFECMINRYKDLHHQYDLHSALQIIFSICWLMNIDFGNAFNELCEENLSKLNFGKVSQEKLAEIFRTGKLNKKSPDGKPYPWFKPADFSKF